MGGLSVPSKDQVIRGGPWSAARYAAASRFAAWRALSLIGSAVRGISDKKKKERRRISGKQEQEGTKQHTQQQETV
jgi:hypothetical protein